MAEALAVVGVVASIVQLVDFGSRVLLRLNEFQSSVGEIPKTFQHIKAELPVLLDTLEQTKTAIQNGSVRDETKKALLPAIDGCRTQIGLLNIVIGKVLPLQVTLGERKVERRFRAFARMEKSGRYGRTCRVISRH